MNMRKTFKIIGATAFTFLLLIVAAMGIIAWEAVGRFSNPSVPPGMTRW